MFTQKHRERKGSIMDNQDSPTTWERKLIEQVITASALEARRARRWKVFFQLLGLAYLGLILFLLLPEQIQDLWATVNPHTSMVEINGVIADGNKADADNIIKGLRSAFEDKYTKGIVLRINSPGGSPVQAGYVYDEILRLRAEHKNIPIYAVIVDVGASAAYYIASATYAIYADKASLVGSIGVLMNGFGFVKAIQNLGIERRLLTAGEHKGILDPFSPMSDQDKGFAQDLLNRMHQQFITAVKNGRKGKLIDDPKIFSGLFWSGEEAKTLGLVDGLGSSDYVARQIIGAEKIINHTHKEGLVDRFSESMETHLEAAMSSMMTPKLQ